MEVVHNQTEGCYLSLTASLLSDSLLTICLSKLCWGARETRKEMGFACVHVWELQAGVTGVVIV